MIFNTEEGGLLTLFRPYQSALVEHIWEMNEKERIGLTSGQLYNWLRDNPDSKSRASVIFFLNDMVDEGILEYEEESGKGGYHKVYYPKMNRKEFADYMVGKITSKLREVFPGTR